MRNLLFILFFAPVLANAQQPDPTGLNADTRAVLLANRPPALPEAQWLERMEQPVNHSLYPLRITQGMLDTLDARQLDPRFHYLMVRDMNDPSHEGVH